MAKGKSGPVGAGILGVLVLIFMIPREIWIALGISAIVALAIYFYIKWKAHKPAEVSSTGTVPRHEPTLAELIGSRPARSPPKLPMGYELWAGISTNYLQLKTIYKQRRWHKLDDWREFCAFIEGLPMSELITK